MNYLYFLHPVVSHVLRRDDDKCLLFPFLIFLFAAQPKELFLDGLKKIDK
jgi:hypothetical protein